MTPQLELDLSPEAQGRGRREEAASLEFSEERLCIAWVTESDGRAWLEWWERVQADTYFRGRMKPYSSVLALSELRYQEERKAAELWAAEIRTAAIARRPVPYSLHEDATGAEKARFEQRLAMAFQIAGVVIVQAPPAEEKPRRRRPAEASISRETAPSIQPSNEETHETTEA